MVSPEDRHNSLKKSQQLSKLQNTIWGDLGTSSSSDFESMQKRMKAQKDALEEYWDLCEADENIAGLMQHYDLSRKELNDVYLKLINVGIGQWVKGHFVALSALAYSEPFYYLMESEQRGRLDGEDFKEVAVDILRYFREEIPNGELYKRYGLINPSSSEEEESYIFCGHCGNKNLAEFSFCTGCGKSLMQATETKDNKNQSAPTKSTSEESAQAEQKTKTVGRKLPWLIRFTILFVTTLSFLISAYLYWGILSGNIQSTANLGTLMQLFAASAPTTLIVWAVVVSLAKSSIGKNKVRGSLILYGFLGMISLWGGVLLAYPLQLEPYFPNSPVETIGVAFLLTPIWFVIGLLGVFVKKSKEKKPRNVSTSGGPLDTFILMVIAFIVICIIIFKLFVELT